MLPGRKFTPEDIVLILKHRVWLLLVPAAVVAAGTALVARQLPDQYEARATLGVTAQQVPENMVKSTVTTKIGARLPSLALIILSRAKLEGLIDENNLYAKQRKTMLMEDVVEQMTKDITIAPLKADSFTVAYRSSSPQAAWKVTERLAALFKDQNLLDRESTAEHTSQFLESQLTDARNRLSAQEKTLQEYREKYSGQLPTQLEGNIQTLQNKWQNIQTLEDAKNRAADKRTQLERQLADLTDKTQNSNEPAAMAAPVDADPGSPVQGGTAQQLASYRSLLASYQQRGWTDQHPDVIRVKRLIAGLEQKADAEMLQAPVSAPAASAVAARVSPAEQQRRAKIESVRLEMDQIDKTIAAKEAEQQKLRADAANLQAAINAVPARENDLTELMRDHATLETLYTSLLTKREQSKISVNLETQEIGQQFKIIDAARLPERPTSPNRPLINGIGIVAGLGLGLLMIGLLEYRDSSFKTDDEVTRLLSLPVLAVVPIMQSDQERRRQTRRRRLVDITLASTVVGCLGIVIYAFIR